MLRAALLAAVGAVSLAAPVAHADAPPGTVDEIAVRIPASLPDDEGRPVVLDGGVDVPRKGCPSRGVIINHGSLGNWKHRGGMAREGGPHSCIDLPSSSRGFGTAPGEA